MKNWMRTYVMALLAGFVVAAPVVAENAAGGPMQACRDDEQKYCSDVQPGGGRILDCMNQHQSQLSGGCQEAMKEKKAGAGAMWKQKLGLTEDQAAKLESAMKAHHDAMQPLREQQRAAMKTLGDQIKSNAGDKAVQGTLDQLKAGEKSIQVESDKFHDQLASFLTPTQQGKMLQGMMMHRGHPMGMQGGEGMQQGMHQGMGQGMMHGGPHGQGSSTGGDEDGEQ